MPIYRLNSAKEWKRLSNIYRLNSAKEWKLLSNIYRLNSAKEWKKIFSGGSIKIPSIQQRVTITPTTDLEGFVTFTGTNYHWTDATSLTYYFEWSKDNGNTWLTSDVLDSGSIANPSSGSSNTKTYFVLQNDVFPNIDNLYRFRVFAENDKASDSSISTTTTINAPRNITISYLSKTFNSITVEFDTPLYSSSYQIKIGTDTFESVTGTVVGGKTRVIATGLSPNTSYSIQVRGFTGGLGSLFGTTYNKGYHGSFSNTVSQTTDPAPTPIQTVSPSAPVGNGLAFTPMSSGSSGTYSNILGSPTTQLISLITTTTPTNGSTTPQGTVRPNLYEVTQDDADFIGGSRINFYTRDSVTALNGTVYYYYSSPVTAFIGTVTDNFNRPAVSSGLGTSSSLYIYSSYANRTSTWSTNGSVANNSTAIALATGATNYPLQTIEVNTPNRTYSVKVPNGNGGIGVAYWVTGSGSWWATVPYYTYQTSTSYSCNPLVTSYTCNTPATSYSCNTPVTTYTCNPFQSTTTYSCTGSGSGSSCPTSFAFEYNAFNVGIRCSECSSSTTTNYFCGNEVTNPFDPGPTVSCVQASDVGKPCSKLFTGFDWLVSYCQSSSSTTYTWNTVASSTTSGCIGSTINTNASGTGCGGCPVTASTACTGGPIGTDPSGSGCGGCPVSASTTCSGPAINTNPSGSGCGGCPVVTQSTCSGGTINTDPSGSGCGGCPVSSSTATTYYTFLDIVASGTLASTKQLAVNTLFGSYNSSGYTRIYSHSSIINNNTITAKAYNSGGSQINTDLVYTASNPIRFGVLGDTSAGLIKGHTDDLNGNSYDDLVIQ